MTTRKPHPKGGVLHNILLSYLPERDWSACPGASEPVLVEPDPVVPLFLSPPAKAVPQIDRTSSTAMSAFFN